MLKTQENVSTVARTILQERWLRIIPTAFVMYTIAYIDRTNISMALPSMSRELHMTPTQAGNAAGIFFWGYLLLQIPGGYLAEHWSAKRFVSVLLVAWGICSVACGLVHTARQFWVMRLLLGVTEGGVWPATLVLLAHWFPRAERARANGYWMLCQPAAVILASPLSGWILGHWDWRVLLISEGAFPFVWLAAWWRFIDDHPRQARWISAPERDHLQSTLLRESAELEPVSPEPFLRTLVRPQVLRMVVVYFLLNCGGYGYLFWLPSVLKGMSKASDLLVAFLFATPYLITGVSMVLVSRHSDRTGERRLHVAVPLALAGVFLLAAVLISERSALLCFVFICLVGPGIYGALGPFWAIPGEVFPRAVAGSAMGLINAIGALGGYFGPLAVGYFNQRTGNFVYAFGVLSMALLASSALTLLFPGSPAVARRDAAIG
jgi:sugar phosphate permease